MASVCLLLTALALFSSPALAQAPASLRGYVRDASTGETLLQANVVIEGMSKGPVTNNAGYYTLQGIEPGTHTLVFSYVGFQRHTKRGTLEAGQEKRLNVKLKPAKVQTEVVTSESQKEQVERQIGTDRLQIAEITQLPSVLQPDVFRSLSLLPGVSTASDYSTGLYIRGGALPKRS